MSKAKVRIRRDDTVVVIAGKERGRVGKVVRVLPEEGRVVVEGVAMIKRHVKATKDQDGRIVEKERAIHVSNVALWDAAAGKRVKVGFKTGEDGTKTRVNKKTGATV